MARINPEAARNANTLFLQLGGWIRTTNLLVNRPENAKSGSAPLLEFQPIPKESQAILHYSRVRKCGSSTKLEYRNMHISMHTRRQKARDCELDRGARIGLCIVKKAEASKPPHTSQPVVAKQFRVRPSDAASTTAPTTP